LRSAKTWLIFNGLVVVLIVADTFRSPSHQATGQCYLCAVRAYQVMGRPLLKGRIQCRYSPTCSVYSAEAVKVHGIRTGLVLTWKRLAACQPDVPLGTLDPVPPANPDE
jgi:putative membrane protein insertion efficiency factor